LLSFLSFFCLKTIPLRPLPTRPTIGHPTLPPSLTSHLHHAARKLPHSRVTPTRLPPFCQCRLQTNKRCPLCLNRRATSSPNIVVDIFSNYPSPTSTNATLSAMVLKSYLLVAKSTSDSLAEDTVCLLQNRRSWWPFSWPVSQITFSIKLWSISNPFTSILKVSPT